MSQFLKKNKSCFIPVSSIFKNMLSRDKDGFTKLQDLLNEFSDNRLLITLIFFSLPIAIPLPYPPGFTSLFAIPLILFSTKLIIGNTEIILPHKIGQYKISNKTLIKIFSKMIPMIRFLESYMKPRIKFTQYKYTKNIFGYLSFISSIFILIPLPFTNAIPALSICIIALGFLNQDGLVLIIGLFIFFIGGAITFLAVTGSFFILLFSLKSIGRFFSST
ncbi:MAG: exopolysaccharide biosynthesis protein [Rickettsia sp.]|nr:exopolysaccharide biosynthesis protein [Rickettsia sp.]